MVLHDWIWFVESQRKVPGDGPSWKFLISQLKTLDTKAAAHVHNTLTVLIIPTAKCLEFNKKHTFLFNF